MIKSSNLAAEQGDVRGREKRREDIGEEREGEDIGAADLIGEWNSVALVSGSDLVLTDPRENRC